MSLANKKISFIAAIIGLAALSRLLPHPPNFAPMAAIALFSGSVLNRKALSFAITFIILALTDLILVNTVNAAFTSTTAYFSSAFTYINYATYAVFILIGDKWLTNSKNSVLQLGSASIVSAIIFFIVSNFGVWAGGSFYSKDLVGLTDCYLAAIPFFQYSVLGNLFYVGFLFGGYSYAKRSGYAFMSQEV